MIRKLAPKKQAAKDRQRLAELHREHGSVARSLAEVGQATHEALAQAHEHLADAIRSKP